MIIPTEANIIYAIIGSVGVLATIIIWLRANTITNVRYYSAAEVSHDYLEGYFGPSM